MSNLSFGIAFVAGLLSFMSPCLLPMIPIYIAYLAGDSFEVSGRREGARRLKAFSHALLFVAGFSVVFVLFGASATALGRLLIKNQLLIRKVGAAFIVLLGLYMMGLFDLLPLDRQRSVGIKLPKVSWVKAFLMGMAFSAGWTPCVGPILASILIMASSSDTVSVGMLLLLAYSLGLGLPFLVVALFVDWFEGFIKRHTTKLIYFKKIAGAMLVAVGALMYLDFFSRYAVYFTGG
ncbi:cytochrome c biogenesis protein [Acetomicrobium mobile DSM 13181]|uniref:Cytochrome c biogenesis protein n=2 Tax=Acetomicrobium TaxID=49894 RepID=I4BZG6_ACEMN|nr:cytochrome c biogenesis protein CcdA [Acetomicrobium mobile]AFM22673.1 cytochrome c biogenesis protein [Acetomicrobium mobile DSM 13181]